jgi:hypothetical protein
VAASSNLRHPGAALNRQQDFSKPQKPASLFSADALKYILGFWS